MTTLSGSSLPFVKGFDDYISKSSAHDQDRPGGPSARVLPIPTSAYPTPAQRPLNSRLDTTRLREAFGLHLPPWQSGVERMLTEFLGV